MYFVRTFYKNFVTGSCLYTSEHISADFGMHQNIRPTNLYVCIYIYVSYLTGLPVANDIKTSNEVTEVDEQERMWQDVIVTDFKGISKRSPERTEEKHEIPQ
jgi:hypothetical protein